MLHNSHLYPEPTEFRPERFLTREGKQIEQDPRTICFGFGRRLVRLKLDDIIILTFRLVSVQVGESLAPDFVLNTTLDDRFTTR